MMEGFRRVFGLLITFLLICCCLFVVEKDTYAASIVNSNDKQIEIKRSLESLQDIDYQTWQIIVYPSSKVSKNLILRIVGYPGSLRIDHPTNLMVKSGRKNWDLKDITKESKANLETLNDSAAEFDIAKMIEDLDKNRPLRLSLPGLINDLPIPPYLVSEWRTLADKK